MATTLIESLIRPEIRALASYHVPESSRYAEARCDGKSKSMAWRFK